MNISESNPVPAAAEAAPLTLSDYQRFIELLGAYAAAKQTIEAIELRVSARLRELASRHIEAFSKLSLEVSDAEEKIEALCRAHPEWFAKSKSKTLVTPFGKAAFRTVVELDLVHDEETVMRLLEKEEGRSLERRGQQALAGKELEDLFDPELYLRRSVKLNREALELLPDDVLARLGIARGEKQSFSLKPNKVDLGELQRDAAKEGGAK